MRYAWYSIVDVAAAGFPRNFSMRFGGHKMFLHLDQVDPVVHFANSASVHFEGNLGDWHTLWYSSSLVFMHTAFSIHIAGSVL